MEQNQPVFYDIDPRTGEAAPTTLASVRAILLEEVALSPDVPSEVADNLRAATDRIGMAYERANAGDWALFGLHNDATIYVARALELALKDRLGRQRGSLSELAGRAVEKGLLRDEDREWVGLLRNLRNGAAHEKQAYGGPAVAATLLRQVARTVNGLYEENIGSSEAR
jgi:hypothetical protein